VENLALVTRMPPRLAGNRLVHLVRGHTNVVPPSYLCKQQTEPYPALGDLAEFGFGCLLVPARGNGLRRDRIRVAATFLCDRRRRIAGSVLLCRRVLSLVLPPDVVELDVDHPRRHGEVAT